MVPVRLQGTLRKEPPLVFLEEEESEEALAESSVKRLKCPQPPVVQTLDSTIQRISIGETNCTIHRIEIYPADSWFATT